MNWELKITTALGRRLAIGALSLGAGITPLPAFAIADNTLPSGGQVTGGSASFDYSSPNALHIHQSTDRAVIDWDSFNIGANALTQFHQPGAGSIVVNRVVGEGRDPTQILGSLRANGIVMVLDRNGVIFGANSRVDVGGIVASTGSINDSTFMAGGPLTLKDIDTGGSVINHGTISVADAGLAAFVAPTVVNSGAINARLGRVQLASGDTATLDLYGDGLIEVAVADKNMKLAITNTGLIHAEGGTVQITAAAAKNVVDSVINMDGIVSASSATVKGGKIILGGGNINIAKDAVLDASGTEGGSIIAYADNETHIAGTLKATGGNGGFIETSATNRVAIADSATIDTGGGTWLIDPTNFTIANVGGDITTATLAAQLAANNITIETATIGGDAGDIFVNDAVTWTGNRTLTLRAHRDIQINATITNTTGGNLVLRADKDGTGTGTILFGGPGAIALSGGGRADLYYNPTAYSTPTNFSGKITGTHTAWMLVNNVTQLQAMDTNRAATAFYALGRDIDASITSTWNGGEGFDPIGGTGSRFYGHLDGLGHTITGLTINRPTMDYVGLIGYAVGTQISNVGMIDVNITGQNYTSSLIGWGLGGNSSITNSYSTGMITGADSVGGLIGRSYSTTVISNSYSSATVTGIINTGGLAGSTRDNTFITNSYFTGTVSGGQRNGGLAGYSLDTTIENSHSTGSVTGTNSNTGGLVGQTSGSTFTDNYATGNVSGAASTGGLIGLINSSTVTSSYATGIVSGSSSVGGLVGSNTASTITGSYATGNVTSTGLYVGGLIGNSSGGTVSGSHATGIVAGSSHFVGGLIGRSQNDIAITNNYATGNVSGSSSTGGLVGTVNGSTFTGNYAMGNVNGALGTGGLIGSISAGTITDSYATGSVSGSSNVGGLVGESTSTSTIDNSHATGSVTGTGTSIGGLVGNQNTNGSITNSHATGIVTGVGTASYIGGLIGNNNASTVNGSHATGTVTGTERIGGLIGHNNNGSSITNSYATGSATGTNSLVGGLIGSNTGSTIIDSYATGAASGASNVGGLVGESTALSIIRNSYATGNATGTGNNVGGLIGNYTAHVGSEVSRSYATGNATGIHYVGGLVGANIGGTIKNAYAHGTATGTGSGSYIGGLVGFNNNGSIENSYATGTTTGYSNIGGLAGRAVNSTITNSYSTGAVSGAGTLGGMIGYADTTTITNSYWDTQTSGRATSAGGAGLTTAEMMQMASFSGWDISDEGTAGTVWRIYEGYTAPLLASFLTTLTISPNQTHIDFTGTPFGGGGTLSYAGFKPGDNASALLGSPVFGGSSQGAVSPGTYALELAGGLYSGQRGYDIVYGPATTLTIAPGTLQDAPRIITAKLNGNHESQNASSVTLSAPPSDDDGPEGGADCLAVMEGGGCVVR